MHGNLLWNLMVKNKKKYFYVIQVGVLRVKFVTTFNNLEFDFQDLFFLGKLTLLYTPFYISFIYLNIFFKQKNKRFK